MQSDRPQPSVTIPTNVTPDHLSPLGFTYWQDGDFWLGYLNEFPDYVTQGEPLVDLEDHLLSLYKDLAGGEIPHVRRHGTLNVA